MSQSHALSRRGFLSRTGALAAVTTLGSSQLLTRSGVAQEASLAGKAKHCIFVWLAGGACHLDTWDPKRKGDAKKKIAGSYYDAIPTAIRDVKVCEHLHRTAPLLDRGVIIRSVHHTVVDEHAAATNRLHTGRTTSGTVVYPSIGSVVSHQRRTQVTGVPSYVVMGYPSASRGPGFLGNTHGYIYLTQTKSGPNGLQRAPDITAPRQRRREELLSAVRGSYNRRVGKDRRVNGYVDSGRAAFELAGPKFMNVFRLENEKAKLRQQYGSEFGQRLLLARRLVQSGVHFVEVTSNMNFKNGTGWDTHKEGQLKQHELIQDLDRGLSSLILDLERCKLLDETLIVVATEFGRPAEFDGGGGRGHQSAAFSVALFGGSLRNGQIIGQTDELGKKITKQPVSVPDLHATIYTALGIDPGEEMFTLSARPVPITNHGKPISELFG